MIPLLGSICMGVDYINHPFAPALPPGRLCLSLCGLANFVSPGSFPLRRKKWVQPIEAELVRISRYLSLADHALSLLGLRRLIERVPQPVPESKPSKIVQPNLCWQITQRVGGLSIQCCGFSLSSLRKGFWRDGYSGEDAIWGGWNLARVDAGELHLRPLPCIHSGQIPPGCHALPGVLAC